MFDDEFDQIGEPPTTGDWILCGVIIVLCMAFVFTHFPW